jgi:hypothetical protein
MHRAFSCWFYIDGWIAFGCGPDIMRRTGYCFSLMIVPQRGCAQPGELVPAGLAIDLGLYWSPRWRRSTRLQFRSGADRIATWLAAGGRADA